MLYSIKDEELNILRIVIDESSEGINRYYTDFVSEISEWGKVLNSNLVLKICKKTVGMIDDEVWSIYREKTETFDEGGVSFVNISEIYQVGDEAVSKVKQFQNQIVNSICNHTNLDVDFSCDGNHKLNLDLVNQYGNIVDRFIKNLEEDYEKKISKAENLAEEKILAASIVYLIRMQYEIIISFGKFYTSILDKFIEWFLRVSKETEEKFVELETQSRLFSEVIAEEHAENVMASILSDGDISGGGSVKVNTSLSTSEGKTGQEVLNKRGQEEEKKIINKALSSAVNDFTKELNSPEKIRAFKQYVKECESQLAVYQQEGNKDKKKGLLSRFFEFIKNGAIKYGKPIAKALAILTPILCPEGGLAISIISALSDLMECFEGRVQESEEAVNKLALGFDLLNMMGIAGLPENPEEIGTYIENNVSKISKGAMSGIMKNETYRDLIGIDGNVLSNAENRKQYESLTGETVKEIPERMSAFGTDLKDFSPNRLNLLTPLIGKDEIKDIAKLVEEYLNTRINDRKKRAIVDELPLLKEKLDSKTPYILFDKGSNIEALIKDLNQIVGKENIVTRDCEGRYNKEDIRRLFEELLAETQNKDGIDFSRGYSNYIRRQASYPSSRGNEYIVNEVKELIPVVDQSLDKFIINNPDLLNLLLNAKKIFEIRGSVIKRKSLTKNITDVALGIGGVLGLGALLLSGGAGTAWGVLLIASKIAETSSQSSNSYSILVASIGDRRTDFLLEKFDIKANGKVYIMEEISDL